MADEDNELDATNIAADDADEDLDKADDDQDRAHD
jgi:hypothetical protein